MPTASKVSRSPKTKTSSTIKKPLKIFKSAPLVEDSDDEDEEHVGIPHKLVKNSIAIESKPSPPKIKPKVLPNSVKPIPTILNGKASKKQKRDGRSSPIVLSDDDKTEDEESGTQEEKVKKVEVDEDSDDDESSEGSSTGSGSGTDSTSRDDKGNSHEDVSQSKETALAIPPKQATSQKASSHYRVPSGFEPATITIPSSSRLMDLFSPDSSRTKQLWHIIVPSSVPINPLPEVSMQSIQNSSAILTHEGADYGLIPEIQEQSAKDLLLLPSAETNEYKPSAVGISKTFHLQQLIPDRRHESRAPESSYTNTKSINKKPVRQQPEGLKMRYLPFGDTEDSSEQNGFESSSKQSMRTPKFRNPISIETSLSSKKNMNHEESDVKTGGDTESAIKKGGREEKKRGAESLAAAESFHTEVQRDHIASPKVSKKRKGPPESEGGGMARPIKKKRKVSLEPLPDARISPSSSNAFHPEASEASKGTKMQKKHANAEQNSIKNPSKLQKHEPPSESVVVADLRLLDEKLDGTRNPIKQKPSVELVSINGYPEDTILPDPPLSTTLKCKNEETSHHGEQPNGQPDAMSVHKGTKQEDEIMAEPMKSKRKSRKEKRRREHSEGKENMHINGYPKDTVLLDPPLSTALESENEETSHYGELLNGQPGVMSVPKEAKQEDEIMAEPMKGKRKSKNKRGREHSEGKENMPMNGYPEDTVLLDAPLSAMKSENEETSHHGEQPNGQPGVMSVRKDTKQKDEIMAEPMKGKRKSKNKRGREHSEGKENMPMNGYPEDTVLLDAPLSTAMKSENEETSHHGEQPNGQPGVMSVRKDTKQEDEIMAEPMKGKRKSKKEKRPRENSEGREHMPAGEATGSATDATNDVKTIRPDFETLMDTPTTMTKPENTMTAEELQPLQKAKRKRHRKHAEGTNSIIAPEQPAGNNHPPGLADAKTTMTTSIPAAVTIQKLKAPTQTTKPTIAAPAPATQKEPTSRPEHPQVTGTREQNKRDKEKKKKKKRKEKTKEQNAKGGE